MATYVQLVCQLVLSQSSKLFKEYTAL